MTAIETLYIHPRVQQIHIHYHKLVGWAFLPNNNLKTGKLDLAKGKYNLDF